MKNIDKRLDDILAIWVKLKYSDDNGNGNCYTCNEPLHYSYMDLGHYPGISRENTLFRWSNVIARIQCTDCNRFKDGKKEQFRDKLVHELGNDKVSRMEFLSKKPYKWLNHDKEQLFKQLKAECKEMLKDKMFNVKLP